MSRTFSSGSAVCAEFGVAEAIAARQRALDSIEERRRWPRSVRGVSAMLRTLRGVGIPTRHMDNVSEGGLRLTVPIGFGLAVGQRLEVLLLREGADGEPDDLVAEGHYGTIVRTEIMLGGEGEIDRVGVGLRFDTPIAL